MCQHTPGKFKRPATKQRRISPGRAKIYSNIEIVNENVDDIEECHILRSAIEAFHQLINKEISMFVDKVITKISEEQLSAISLLIGKNIRAQVKSDA